MSRRLNARFSEKLRVSTPSDDGIVRRFLPAARTGQDQRSAQQ
jgi:hypothetical protein